MHPKPLGAKPVKPDYRDYLLPAPYRVGGYYKREWTSDVRLDQGAYGTCVGNAWTHLLTSTPRTHSKMRLLNPDRQPAPGTGGYWPRDFTGDSRGAERYAIHLYDAIHDGTLEAPDPGREAGASPQHGGDVLHARGLLTYYRLPDVAAVLDYLGTQGPVVFASPWYRSMDTPVKHTDGSHWVEVDPASGLRGYHCYLLSAIDTAAGYVDLFNSWGFSWGIKNKARLAIDDIGTVFMNQAFGATEARV